ncbi:hypothetical protein [Cohnella fermenti]|uniref:Uncharacterized protein n=1 Tax=Cohnella fermenti TaxID=2565925 RepID=A0A4S4BIF9_9BACL|nr:hypothetical protein [Cohnella fermenti]THF74382.1 hypothetical protein E6C55_25400 [Cohnella fermenti]
MKQALFLGATEKSHLLLTLGKLLVQAELRVLLVDSTIAQTIHGYLPVSDTRPGSFVLEFEGLDIAAGFINRGQLERHFRQQGGQMTDYDVLLLDTDHTEFVKGCDLSDMTLRVWCASPDRRILSKNAELLQRLCLAEAAVQPVPFVKLVHPFVPTAIPEAYFDALQSAETLRWGDLELRIPLNERDVIARFENQHHARIAAKRLSGPYVQAVMALAKAITGFEDRTIKNAWRRMRREKRGT